MSYETNDGLPEEIRQILDILAVKRGKLEPAEMRSRGISDAAFVQALEGKFITIGDGDGLIYFGKNAPAIYTTPAAIEVPTLPATASGASETGQEDFVLTISIKRYREQLGEGRYGPPSFYGASLETLYFAQGQNVPDVLRRIADAMEDYATVSREVILGGARIAPPPHADTTRIERVIAHLQKQLQHYREQGDD